MIDYYKILEVRTDASPEVIEKAYKALSMKHHPDKQSPEARNEATERMKLLNEAYSVLSDPVKRSEYDAWRTRQYLKIFWENGLIGLFKVWIEY